MIIPVWNCWHLTAACLRSLRETVPGDFLEVIVVDNGSTDTTASELESLGATLFGKRFLRMRNDRNEGFAVACNAGAAQASGPLLFFLNNDTLLQEGWLKPLMCAPLEEPKLGAWGPLLAYPALPGEPERVQHLGVAFSPSLAHEHLYANFPVDHSVTRNRRPLQAITGAAFMIPTAFFAQCGGFHEGYQNGYEDLDLCAAIRKAGRKLAVIPESRVIHLESMTPGRMRFDEQNASLLMQRCSGAFSPDLHRLARRDGYETALTPWLHLYLCVCPERERELSARALELSSSEELAGLINEEPLWEKGHTLFTVALEREGHITQAVRAATLRAYFFPQLSHYRDLLRLSLKVGDTHIREETTRAMGAAIKKLEDAPGLRAKAAAFERWARDVGEPALADLYAEKAKNTELLAGE